MMTYHDNMSAAEQAQLLADCQAQEDAYARSEAWHWLQHELRKEFYNMRDGAFFWDNAVFSDEGEAWNELRRAALDHRGRP